MALFDLTLFIQGWSLFRVYCGLAHFEASPIGGSQPHKTMYIAGLVNLKFEMGWECRLSTS